MAGVRDGRAARRGQLHEEPIGLAELAVADTELRAITALLREVLEEARAVVEQGGRFGRRLQARILLAGMHDVAADATAAAHALAGAAATSGSTIATATATALVIPLSSAASAV
jgi:hypothetical protein